MTPDLPEANESLLSTVAAPAIWAAHFLLSYITAAVWCAKVAGADGSLVAVQRAISLYTVLALAAIGLIGWRAWGRHRLGDSPPPHDQDAPGGRHRFLGFAGALLSGLSALAVIFSALASLFFGSCR
ncbi:MAG: hypothetical protein Q8S42_19665 [Archangium sp.]|nr:hypothetical protein [Archangium sp.]